MDMVKSLPRAAVIAWGVAIALSIWEIKIQSSLGQQDLYAQAALESENPAATGEFAGIAVDRDETESTPHAN